MYHITGKPAILKNLCTVLKDLIGKEENNPDLVESGEDSNLEDSDGLPCGPESFDSVLREAQSHGLSDEEEKSKKAFKVLLKTQLVILFRQMVLSMNLVHGEITASTVVQLVAVIANYFAANGGVKGNMVLHSMMQHFCVNLIKKYLKSVGIKPLKKKHELVEHAFNHALNLKFRKIK